MSLYLRGWIGIVGIAALANSVQCLYDNLFPKRRIYSITANEGSSLAGRLFGVWTLLAAAVRIAFVFSPNDTSLYIATLSSFLLAFYHFTTEVFVYRTAPMTTGTTLPLIISGLSILWMSFELLY